ncbi:MAG: 30S ribosomal protein S12 methylthiotransferase RimO [Bacteroidota bacterium]
MRAKQNGKNNSVHVQSLGCAKNLVDSEQLMRQITGNGMDVAATIDDASVVVINTCGFIGPAKEESVNEILSAVHRKLNGRLEKVFVMGCLSERYRDDLLKEIPEVDGFFGTKELGNVIKALGGNLQYELLGERMLLTPKYYAFLKISEGCDNPCSFCAIPIMRGKHITKPMESLIHEAEHLAHNGVKELVLIAQDLTYYGMDLYHKRELKTLLHNLSQIDGIEWIRLMYSYPAKFPREILEEIADNPKICNYLDMPVQHASDNVLKSMRRGITNRAMRELIDDIRKAIPDITLRSTYIVGYPNETEDDFEELCDFTEYVQFDRLGVFKYSIEDDTTAYSLGDTIPEPIKQERYNTIMALQQNISLKNNRKKIGTSQRVLIERKEGKKYIGRSIADAPEVDGQVFVTTQKKLEVGKFYDVEITNAAPYDLFGTIEKL